MNKYSGSIQRHWEGKASAYGQSKGTYNFNEYGYRETNHDLSKPITYICGCSHTLGIGLDYEDTWAFKLGKNHLNFSEGGAGNAYIARTLIAQCELHKPELVIAHFSYFERVDYWFENEIFCHAPVGKWVLDIDNLGDKYADKVEEVKSWAASYYKHYTQIEGKANTLTQMLLLQFYCKTKNIPLIMMCVEKLDNLNTELKLIADMIDLCPLSIIQFQCDKASDGVHGGLKTNESFANALREKLNGYRKRFNKRCF